MSIICNLLLFSSEFETAYRTSRYNKGAKKFEDYLQNKSNEKSFTITEIKKQFAAVIENQQKYYQNIIEKYKEEINSLRGELQA